MSTATPGTSSSVPRSTDELLARMDQDWMPFRLAAASLGMRVIEQPTSTGWTYKQMLAHVAAWHELTARRLRTFRQTGDQTYPADVGGTDDVNARAAARAAGLTADEVLRELDRTRIELRDAVAALTDEQIGRDVQDTPWGPASWAVTVVAGNSYGHYDEHRDEIMGGVPRTAADLIARVEQSWLPFRSTIESVGIRDLSRRTSSGWTAKGLLGHVTHWMEQVLPELPVRLRGERSTPPDVDAANAAASLAADALPAPEVLRKLDAAYERLLAALRALDPASEVPFLAVRLVAGETYAHFVEHAPELRELWPRSRDELIARIEVEWRTLRDAVRQLGRARIGEAIGDGWTYKDMLAHVAAWLAVTPRRIEAIRGGHPDPVTTTKEGVDEFNRRAVESRRLVGPEAMLDELDTSYRRFLTAVRTVTDDEVAGSSLRRGILSLVAWESYLHFEDHYPDLGVPEAELRRPEAVRREDMAERGLDGW